MLLLWEVFMRMWESPKGAEVNTFHIIIFKPRKITAL